MNKVSLTVAIGIGLAAAASAQARLGDVTMSTDPAKVAAVERQAAELRAESVRHTAHAAKPAARHHAQRASMHHQTEAKSPAKS